MVVTSLSDLYESRGCWPTADSVCWLAWMDDGCGQGREFTISICAGDPKKRGHGDGGIQGARAAARASATISLFVDYF